MSGKSRIGGNAFEDIMNYSFVGYRRYSSMENGLISSSKM
jgi:hypothetical protein